MKKALTLVVTMLLLAAASLVLAQGSNFSLDWWAVADGGLSENGRFTLESSVAQPNNQPMANGRYTILPLDGGGTPEISYSEHLPVVLRQ